MLVVACLALPIAPGCHSARVLFFPASLRSVDTDREAAELARDASPVESDGDRALPSGHEPFALTEAQSAGDAAAVDLVPDAVPNAAWRSTTAELHGEQSLLQSWLFNIRRALRRITSPADSRLTLSAALVTPPDVDAFDGVRGRLPERLSGRYMDFARWPVAAYVGSSHLSYGAPRRGHGTAEAGEVGFMIVALTPLDDERGFVGGVAPDGAGVIAFGCLTAGGVSLELVARSHLLGVPTALSYDAEQSHLLVWDAEGARLWELDFERGGGSVIASLSGDPEASDLVGLTLRREGEGRTLSLIDVPVRDLGHGGVPERVITIHDLQSADGQVDRFVCRSAEGEHAHDAWLEASRLEAELLDAVVVAPLDDICAAQPAPASEGVQPLQAVRVLLPDGRAVDLAPDGWQLQLRKLAASWPPGWHVVVEVPAGIEPAAMYAVERLCETLALDYELRFR